jgi:hypothetical protein
LKSDRTRDFDDVQQKPFKLYAAYL